MCLCEGKKNLTTLSTLAVILSIDRVVRRQCSVLIAGEEGGIGTGDERSGGARERVRRLEDETETVLAL